MCEQILHVGVPMLGGYLLAMGADQGPLGATIGAVAGVAHMLFGTLSMTLEPRQRCIAFALINAAVGTAAISAFLAYNIISDVGLLIAGAYYGLPIAVNLFAVCCVKPVQIRL